MSVPRWLACVAAAVLLLAAGCGGDADEAADEQPAEADLSYELTLGATVPYTGDISTFGEPMASAMEMALQIVNETTEAMGLDVSVNLVIQDDQSDARAGVEAATALVQAEQVDILLASIASAVTIPIAESVAIPNDTVMIVPVATSPAIAELEDDGLVFRTSPPDTLQGQAIARVLARELGEGATVNTGTRNDAYGIALRDVFQQHWTEAGGEIGRSVEWNPEAPTFDTEAAQLAGGEPDAWLLIDFPETWARMGPALVRAGGWEIERTYTTDALATGDLPDLVGEEATEGLRGTVPSTGEGETAAAFDREWRERVDVDRHAFDANAFDAVIVAFLATVAAGGTDPEAVKEEVIDVTRPPGDQYTFEQLEDAVQALLDGQDIDYQGASGPIDMDDRGDPTSSAYEIWTFQDGSIETVEILEAEELGD